MSSIRALKRRSELKRKQKSEHNQLFSSCPNLSSATIIINKLRRNRSESDVHTVVQDTPKIFHQKSERNLQSLFSQQNFLSSTPCGGMSETNSPSQMQTSSYSVITDNAQIKIPIVGFEIIEERSKFTVSCLMRKTDSSNTYFFFLRFLNFESRIMRIRIHGWS